MMPIVMALAALSIHAQSQAQTQGMATKEETGPCYFGFTHAAAFGSRELNDSGHSNAERFGRSNKVYAGYQLNETYGVQIGHVRFRELNQNSGSGAALVTQSVAGHSTYVAGTARLPLGHSFALTGKLGASFGKVTSASPSTAASNLLLGHETSLLVGAGVEFVLNRSWAIALELENHGKLSNQVKAYTLGFGTRFMF